MLKISIISIVYLMLSLGCKDTVDHAWKNDITIINSFNQDIEFRLYWSRVTFNVKSGEYYIYHQQNSDGPTLDYDGSDSIVVTFADGRRKTDYNCFDKAVALFVKDCNRDSISLFNSFRYKTIKQGENSYMNYYTITQADYDEAK